MKAGTLTLRCILLATSILTFSFCSDEFVDDSLNPPEDQENLAPETKSTSGFRLGVAGHALGTEPYINTPAEEQMRMVKNMGMNLYRFSVLTKSDGSVTVPWRLDPFVKAANAAGVTLLPMLHHITLDFSVSNAESYQRGKTLGRNFARHYKDIFTYYELGNELDNKCIIPGKAGKSRLSYDQKKFKTIAAYLKGMNSGIKSVDPTAKTVINASWLHYAYLLMLEEHGIDFDIIGYHWYSEMESLAKKSPYNISDITQRLSSKFNKPIWFTEVNARPRDVYNMELLQDSFLRDFVAKAKRNSQVQALIIYELFDEPQKNDFLERNYGIVKWKTPFSTWANKMAAQTLINSN